MSHNLYLLVLIVTIVIAAIYAFVSSRKTDDVRIEKFTASAEDQVIALYAEVYNRQPSNKELKSEAQKLRDGNITIEGMRQRMINSVEYGNLIKLQSNSLTPELGKMLSDRDLLNKLSQIYKEECAKTIPPKMVLPLRDVYIYLDYNEYAFRAMLRDGAYSRFEENVMTTPDLNNPQVMDAFNGSFNKNDLVKTGQHIAETEADKASQPTGVSPTCKYDRSISDTDSDSCLSLTKTLENAQAAFDKNAAARAMTNGNEIPDFDSEAARTDIRIPTHRGDMVLLPEMAWSVPQYRAPVCTTLGKPLLTQPISEEKNILRGTPLNLAKNDTRVGSIMPSFQHKEFITVKQ